MVKMVPVERSAVTRLEKLKVMTVFPLVRVEVVGIVWEVVMVPFV
jgi:hypothetical protein